MGILQRRQKEKDKRRHKILLAAKKIFFKKGFHNTSMELIAEDAQLSKGTIYLYFRSKDELYVSLLEEGLVLLNKLIAESENPEKTPDVNLLNAAESLFNFADNYHEYFNILFGLNTGEILSIDNVGIELKERLETLQTQALMRVVKTYQQGVDNGLFTNDISPYYAVVNLWVAITGAIKLTYRQRPAKILENIDTLDLIKDITKTYLIAYGNSENLKNELKKSVFESSQKRNLSYSFDFNQLN